ncbi:Extensin like [Actinidia chinensis var. chinensis]|uniref:Extensin like n=1 Tax=Actinidia chinensis var. chinensis TaxID=1590841 RepID=A0A2R6RXK9_ACTCC|nr:Extensin like [Actinidia chinensis var. chinensis]
MGVILYLDTILVPLSLFLTIGYHAFLWHNIKNKPFITTIGIQKLRRKAWLQDMKQGDDKKNMLAVQSLRNTLLGTILSATIAIIIVLAVGALTNNSYNATHLITNYFFGSQSDRILMLKYCSASLFLLASFLCSSVAVGCFVDANFLINATSADDELPSTAHTGRVLERGFSLAVVGNRLLCIAFPLLLWLLGPVPVALSSVALVWGLYELDFACKLAKNIKQGHQ